MPVFVVGAAYGRLFGEIVSAIFPEGIPGGTDQPIFPGIYAVVGAAALTASITHSVSVAVICCEMTGQYIYIIPLMVNIGVNKLRGKKVRIFSLQSSLRMQFRHTLLRQFMTAS